MLVVFLIGLIIGIFVMSDAMKNVLKRIKKEHSRFCKPNCCYLFPTEEEQTSEKEAHWCAKYGERLYHRSNHPKIVKCRACKNKG